MAQWVWRRRSLNFIYVFLQFRYYLPFKKNQVLHLYKLESLSPQDDLCQVCLKLAQQLWRRRLINFINIFLLFHYNLPLEKGRALHLSQLESPSPKDALCQVWLYLAQWFWRRRWKCVKFTDRRSDGWTTDNRLSEKFHWACSSGELKKNVDQQCSSWD